MTCSSPPRTATVDQGAPDDDGASKTTRASLLCYLHSCILCGAASSRHYCHVPSLFVRGTFINYERCDDCGVVFQNPRLPAEERLVLYERKPLLPSEAEIDPVSRAHCDYVAGLARRLLSPSRVRLLDFGCGAGEFLVAARSAGFDAYGLEVNKALAADVTRRYGVPVFCGRVTDAGFKGEPFDIIVSRQVFEHLVDPRSTLNALKGHLTKGGLLLIEVPNVRHVRERVRRGSTMDDSHLFYFSRSSLSRLLVSSGFSIVHVAEGLRPFRFFAGRGRTIPPFVVRATELFFSACQLKTGLRVIARLG